MASSRPASTPSEPEAEPEWEKVSGAVDNKCTKQLKLDSVRAGTLALCCLVLLGACDRSEPVDSSPATAPRPAVNFGELEVDGQKRTYRVFAPPTIEVGTPAPLVLALHDAFGSAESFRDATQFDRAATAGISSSSIPRASWGRGTVVFAADVPSNKTSMILPF